MSTHGTDPYTAKAASEVSPSQKIEELKTIIGESKFSMLTTRSPNGLLHSRAMSAAGTDGLVFSFIANTDSGKFDDLTHDEQVNISWSSPSSTNWASAAGTASVLKDVEHIKPLWNPAVKAWFGDLGDGKHTGDYNDPRVAVIQVVPAEIRYWIKTKTSLTQAYEVAKGALTGETAAPGALRVINASDLELARKIDDKKV